jgi:LPXTG-site transpeptidase (sortase) family protein
MGSKLLWTLGNLLMVAGLYLLAYVGGLYAEAEHNRLAARGDNDLPAPAAISLPASEVPAAFTAPVPVPAPFAAPVLNDEGQAISSPPSQAQAAHVATISRVVIPSIDVDSKVVEVGWEVVEQQGQQVAIWQVAEYAVGQHKGSANPGEGENIVLAGHVGGYGKVFRDLFYVKPGDEIVLYSQGQQYLYVVQERLVLLEEGVPQEQRAANARYIEPAGQEIVTLITCWPPKGKNKFAERVVVRAAPYGASLGPQAGEAQPGGAGAWTAR